MGAASLKMKIKIAAMPMMLLQPQTRMMNSIGFSSASRTRNFLRARAGAGSGIGVVRSVAREPGTEGTAVEALAFIGIASGALLQRDKAFLLDNLLAGGSEAPFDVGFDFSLWLACGVHVELARNRIFSVPRHVDARLDTRLAFFI